jgi:DNA-binding LacI/PurR family transcriptional regulator
MAKYVEIMNAVAEDIEVGKYKPGSVLPTEKDLRRKYNVSITTIKKAMNTLREKGYVDRKQGSGTYVREKQYNQPSDIINVGIIVNLYERNTEQSFFMNCYTSNLLAGLKRAFAGQNVNIMVAAYHQDNPEPWEEIQSGLKMDAFLDLGCTISEELEKHIIANNAKALSIFNTSTAHRCKLSFPYVLIDHLDGVRDAVRHYKKLGYNKFGYIALAEAGLANFRDFENVLAEEEMAFDMESVIIHPENTRNLNNLQKRIEQIGKNIINNRIKPDVFFFDGATNADALIDFFIREKSGLENEIRHCVIDRPDSGLFQSGVIPDFIVPAPEEAGFQAGKLLVEYIKHNKIENETKISPTFIASK